MEVLESLFARALKLESPWKITKIEFRESKGVIKVFVDFPRGSVLVTIADPRRTHACPGRGLDTRYDVTNEAD